MKKSKSNKRYDLVWLFGFLIFWLVVDILFFPYLLNWLCGFFRVGTFAETALPGEHLFLNWKWCFADTIRSSLAFSFHFLLIALMVYVFFSMSKGSINKGDEHGSARKMTDDEFDDLIPNYDFREDEYNYERPSQNIDAKSLITSSASNVFEEVEFKLNDKEVK